MVQRSHIKVALANAKLISIKCYPQKMLEERKEEVKKEAMEVTKVELRLAKSMQWISG